MNPPKYESWSTTARSTRLPCAPAIFPVIGKLSNFSSTQHLMRKLFPSRTFTVLCRSFTTKPSVRQGHATATSSDERFQHLPSTKPLYRDHEPSPNDKGTCPPKLVFLNSSLRRHVRRCRLQHYCSSLKTKGKPALDDSFLIPQGYDLHGVFMRNWTDDSLNKPCRSETDWKDVQDVCQYLSIPCERVYFPLQRESSVLMSRLI